GLQALIDAGIIAEQPVRPLAHLVHGALIEAALVTAGADDPAAARQAMGAGFDRLLGLAPTRPEAPRKDGT
ncbi:MAG TPA: hypothetical protein VFI22_02540, partial [Thermomicrobiales bacterium]|nr:hypothetical protein [Thermomicrobiales bacterium]